MKPVVARNVQTLEDLSRHFSKDDVHANKNVKRYFKTGVGEEREKMLNIINH